MGYYDIGCYVGSVQYAAVAPWAATHAYSVGNIVRQLATPSVFSERCFVCLLAGTSLSSEPSWGSVSNRGSVVTESGGPQWIDITGLPAFNGDKTNTLTWAQFKAIFSGSVLCSVGNVIQDVAGAHYFVCTTQGTNLSSSEPTWNTTPGATTVDNQVTWTCVGLTSSFTAAWAAPHKLVPTAMQGGTNTGMFLAGTGGKCFIADNHSESFSSGAAIDIGGANQAILCVDHTASVPPGSGSLRTGATITTTAGYTIGGNPGSASLSANGYVYGLSITSTATSGVWIAGQGNTFGAYRWRFESCTFVQAATSGGAQFMTFGSGAMCPYPLNEFVNCTFSCAYAQQLLWFNGNTKLESCTFSGTLSGSSGVGLFAVGVSNASGNSYECHTRLMVEGCDLSGIASGGSLIYTGTKSGSILFKDCTIASGLVLITGGDVVLPDTGLTVEFNRCDAGGTAIRNERHITEGTLLTNTAVVRTGGSSDGATAVSHQITTTSKVNWVRQLPGLPLAIWNAVTGTNRNVTVYGIVNDSRVPNNDEMWFDVEYLGSASSPKGSYARGGKANVLATGSALTADTSAWDSAATARANTHAYSVGNVIKTASNAGRVFFCTGAGTSAASEPAGVATTWNSSDSTGSITFSNGNLTAQSGASGQAVRSNYGAVAGKLYWEYTATTPNSAALGIGNSSTVLSTVASTGVNSCIFNVNGQIIVNNTTVIGNIGTVSSGAIIGIALDVVNQLIWFRNGASGSWNATSGSANNPATGTGGISISAIASGPLYALFAAAGLTAVVTANFGASGFTGTVPSGFIAWNTMSLISYSTAVDGNSIIDGTATFRAGCRFSQTITLGGLTTAPAFDPANKGTDIVLSSGNLAAGCTASTFEWVRTTTSIATGHKVYFEVTFGAISGGGNNTGCGINRSATAQGSWDLLVLQAGSGQLWYNGANTGIAIGTFSGQTLACAIDLVNNRFWARVASTGSFWNASSSADPATNVGGLDISALFAGVAAYPFGSTQIVLNPCLTANFGPSFTYTVPSGFSALPSLTSAQPAQPGYLYAYPKIGRPSMTYYLDPMPVLS